MLNYLYSKQDRINMELIIRHARIRGREMNKTFDIGIKEGYIAKIHKHIEEQSDHEIDASGKLATPSFANMHFHLDTALTIGEPHFNQSGTLLEGIEIWGERKKTLSEEKLLERVDRAIKWMVAYGTTILRTHADTSEPTLTTVKGLLKAKKMFKDIMDIQVTAFPQDGIMTSPENAEALEKALELGVDNVGMIPHNEYTREDGIDSIELAFKLAEKYNCDIDGHVDETDDPNSRFLEVVAAQAIKNHMEGRVAAGHATAMGSYDNAYAYKLFGILKKAQITIVSNPLINIHLQGRFDTYPKRRGLTRIKELIQAGINVCLGHDCMMDPWYPLGVGNMLQVLFMAVHVAQLTGYQELMRVLDLITTNAAKALQLNDYGMAEGKRADMLILNAYNDLDALRLLEPPLFVIKEGEIIAHTSTKETIVCHNGKEECISFSSAPR
jgi:cytosine deaminase